MKKTDGEEKGREQYIDAEILSCSPIITTEKLFVSTLTYLQFLYLQFEQLSQNSKPFLNAKFHFIKPFLDISDSINLLALANNLKSLLKSESLVTILRNCDVVSLNQERLFKDISHNLFFIPTVLLFLGTLNAFKLVPNIKEKCKIVKKY